MKKAIIVDIDGTLADVEHRVHHVRASTKDWKSFNEGMGKDKLNHWCAKLIDAMKTQGYEILFVTGRDENYRETTLAWMKQHQVSFDKLYMRAAVDFRPDDEVKKEIYLQEIKDHWEVTFVVDDRLSVVKMWREQLNLVCLQCDWGDF
tara:strand:- start:12195 stop:12638 length:444 start_codon:yes stop_codon:yes gene_type:complete